MWYPPEHPGPYPAPAEPAPLKELGIAPPEPEPPAAPVCGQVNSALPPRYARRERVAFCASVFEAIMVGVRFEPCT